jgi:TonB family protein
MIPVPIQPAADSLANEPEIERTAPVASVPKSPESSPKGSRLMVWAGLAVVIPTVVFGYFLMHRKAVAAPVSVSATAKPGQGSPANPTLQATETQNAASQPTLSPGESQPVIDPQLIAAQVKAALEKGNAHFDQGEYQAAIDAYQKGLEVDPYNIELLRKVQDAQSAWETENRVEGSTGETAQRVRVAPDVMKGMLTNMVKPVYPPLASKARVQGDVVLKAFINPDGIVESLSLIKGHPMLAPSAIEAVKQWRYQPYHIGERHVSVETTITVKFSLSEQ